MNRTTMLILSAVLFSVLPSTASISLLQTFSEQNSSGTSNFGSSVAGVGDVNGDGYEDVIVGAHGFSNYTGRAYLFFGGSPMNNTADVTFTGETENSSFGYAVAGAGDVNNDGFADIIIGAYRHNSNTGKAYLYFGGAAMDNSADVTMNGGATNNYFGYAVAGAGKVNGDAYADVVVSAYGYNSNTGRAYVYYGGNPMNNGIDVTLTGSADSYFGTAVAGGDVNHDGFADVIVGANSYNSGVGRAYIYYGGSSMNNVVDVTITGEAASNRFGSAAAAADVNKDTYADVIVGAWGYSSNTGRAYIFNGSGSMPAAIAAGSANVIMTGGANGDYFGRSVAAAGDVNGDTFADVVVGASGYSSETGRAYLYVGGASMDNVADLIVTGETAYSRFGISVAGAGDVNNDGYADLFVGAGRYNNYSGRAYLYHGGSPMDNSADLIFDAEGKDNYFGAAVADAGDVNNDGYGDVVIGAYNYNESAGRCYLYYGGNPMDNSADVIMTGVTAGDYFGISVAGAGDVNGDGYGDVVVGASGYNSESGRAYLFLGGSSMDNGADLIIAGDTEVELGRAVAGQDVNGDGYADLMIGQPGYDNSRGRVSVYYGGTPLDNTADVSMTGEWTYDQFGFSVAGAGDVNGDGYGDVLVGAYRFNSATGRAYIFYGDFAMDNTADMILNGEAVNDQFGFSVSGAGDVNKDDYADILIGANNFSSGTGRAYLFYGSNPMNAAADVVMTGGAADYQFGFSLSDAGDVNKDGYADIIIGEPGYDEFTGRAFVFFGGASMDNTADYSMLGEGYDNYFGWSVSGAGDVNKDGRADVIVGAYTYPVNGKVYIFQEDTPIDVKLSTFAAVIKNGAVHLHWRTESEANHAGFNLWRSNHRERDFVRINRQIILADHYAAGGDEYEFFDTPEGDGPFYYKLEDVTLDGTSSFSSAVEAKEATMVTAERTPMTFSLHQNHPNPFNPTTTIRFDLPTSSQVALTIFDVRGRQVRTLRNDFMVAGAHTVVWDAQDDQGLSVAGGMYFCRLQAERFEQIIKMTLVK